MARQPRKPAPKRARKPAARSAGGISFYRSESYVEIPNGDGIMRCEAGDYVVTGADGAVSVKPPSVFAVEHPDLAD